MTETTDNEALLSLLEPFPAEQVGKLPRVTCTACSNNRGSCSDHDKARCNACGAWVSTKHIHLDYVGHADVTRRLLETDPAWQWEPLAEDENGLPIFDTDAKDNPVGLWIKLTVLGVTRRGYGSCPSGQNDAVKVLIGDALRNAAMRFGVALDLWAKGDRADPAVENATASGGQAARRRPARPPRSPEHRRLPGLEAPQPARQQTDHTWLADIEKRIGAAESLQELATLASEVIARKNAGYCEAAHETHLWELGKQREQALSGPPRNKDGSISRSRMSDEELAANGSMTSAQVREHNKLAKDVQSSPKAAERLTTTPEGDPWTAEEPPS
jgi:hypothetical protein